MYPTHDLPPGAAQLLPLPPELLHLPPGAVGAPQAVFRLRLTVSVPAAHKGAAGVVTESARALTITIH